MSGFYSFLLMSPMMLLCLESAVSGNCFILLRILCHFALLQDLFKSVARAISHHVMETTKGLPTSGNCM